MDTNSFACTHMNLDAPTSTRRHVRAFIRIYLYRFACKLISSHALASIRMHACISICMYAHHDNRCPSFPGHYLYVDANFGSSGSRAMLLGTQFGPSSATCQMQFWYFMHGSGKLPPRLPWQHALWHQGSGSVTTEWPAD